MKKIKCVHCQILLQSTTKCCPRCGTNQKTGLTYKGKQSKVKPFKE